MATMRRLIPRSTHFMLVARNSQKLTLIAQDLLARGAVGVDTWVIDLDDTSAHADMLVAAVRRLGEIDVALIAHGVLGDQSRAEADFEAAAEILHTNFISAVSLITWLANYFQRQHKGTLAVISSVAGDRGRKSNYVYGASKGALNIFLDGVRNRVDREGVHVMTIKPGFVATPMTSHLPQGRLFATPDKIAKGIVKGLHAHRDNLYVPSFWAPIMLVIRLIPNRIFKKLNI
jgi:short-subunit dehydrogenase